MSSAGISFGGLASGLDTKSIIAALVAVERRPITALEAKKTSLNKQKSLFDDLDGLLGKLATAAKALKTTTGFLAFKAASSDETVLKVTASPTAEAGTHSLRVMKLAQAKVIASSGSASPTAVINNGGQSSASLVIQTGTRTEVISVGSPSLQSIAAAINARDDSTDMGVRAEVVDTGDTQNGGANRYQLVMRATKTGVANDFTVSLDEGSGNFATFVNALGSSQPLVQAQDAELLLNGAQGGTSGVTVRRSTNQISDLWAGITLDLQSANTTKDIQVTVTRDTEASEKKMQDFVDAYNKVVDFAVEQNVLGADGKAKNPLFGDATLRSLRNNLRSAVNAQVTDTGNPAFQLLAQVGIKSDTAGKLTFDKTKFGEALAEDQDAVTKLFTNATTGIANRLVTQVDAYEASDGLIASRTESLGRMVRDTQSRIDRSEQRIATYQKQLEAKYASLENLLTKLQSQGSSVSNIGR